MRASLTNLFRISQKDLWAKYAVPFLIIGGCTLVFERTFPHIDIVNMAMIYLLANVIIAVYYGQGPSIASAILSVTAFDFFFVTPRFALTVNNARFWITFSVMFIVTIVTGRLTIQSRRSGEKALAAEMEVERERLVSSLLSSVSHDLRTPLTSISGAASTLLDQETKIPYEDRRHLLEMINHESVRLNRFVEKILQITKIESGNMSVRKERHSLEEIIGGVLNRLDSYLEDRRITTEVPGDLFASCDDLLIEQVLVNLIENALRYTPAGSPIDIRAFQETEQVWVEILDRGPGVPKQEQDQIFEKFYRSGKKDAWSGGLGLAVCEGILKIHQGQIGVRDREGGGSVFYFSLPISEKNFA
jgi:K+-sensing histidine kinase KdpD